MGLEVILVLDFTTNSIISALVPCKLATEETFPFLTNLNILSAAIIFLFIMVSIPIDCDRLI